MKVPRDVGRRAGSLFGAVAMLVATAAPALVTGHVSAAQITSRKISMSTATPEAADVDYKVEFTPTQDAGALVVEFCDSPVISEACNAPADFDSGSATVDNGTIADGYTSSTNSVRVTDTFNEDVSNDVVLGNITNPSTVGTFYARLITYASGASATTGHNAAGAYGTHLDDGGIALSTTEPIEVRATIRENLVFCVRDTAPATGCTGGGSPTVNLGHGSPAALDYTARDTDSVYSQISTNAVEGAIVRMKSNNACGGLFRAGESDPDECGIPPVATGSSTIPAGTALFGMTVGAAADATGSDPKIGTTVADTDYDGGQYGMNWVSGNATGVSSTYGDDIYTTNGEPISNKNVQLTFAATASVNTPAGSYSADMSLIATGTF